MAATVTEYCTNHSNDVSDDMKELWDWTVDEFEDSDKMSSPLQGATMQFLAQLLGVKRVLEIGCYSGYSALAWYESTKQTKAEIVTLELDPKMIRASQRTIEKYKIGDRVHLIQGPAQDSIQKLTGTFDLVFVDANKEGYEGYVKAILDKKLLSPSGLIMCDNVFARGMTISTEANPHLLEKVRPYWTECGKALRRFNTFCKSDPRIDTILMPVYDGVTFIKWKQ
ncbi:O-methyltransferase [Massarina eburnea CBS 473.64]|uniref:O-methyltransferase n=1 Tax=Massarina eburnea CBS 473.64 TaxID=1395130 RepID=A0A6A6SA72_9PLEO|nr:O-methyltransferase [Massarina eburnea CBS 473.64]